MNPSTVFDFSGRTALVTGATGGMGRGIATNLARCGADVVIQTTRTDGAGERLAEEVGELGVRTLVVTGDVADLAGARRWVQAAAESFGGIDFLVNNAGILELYDVVDMSEPSWDRIIEVNLKGPVFLTQAAMGGMIDRGRGGIVNIGSSLSANGGAGAEGVPYNISKAGLQCFTKTLAKQLATHGIRVNSVSPGIIDTPMLRGPFPPEDVQGFADDVPIGRLGLPEDVADATVFLLSDAASYITGQAIHVNGGLMMVDH